MYKRLISVIAKLSILLLISNVSLIGFTNANFTDNITSIENEFTADIWITPTPTVTPSPSPVPSITATVVINEVMWMGSTKSTADEWIELRNLTDHEIDIGQWTLENTKDGGDRKLMISAGKNIPAHGYFLISNYPKTAANSALNVDVNEVANLEFLNSSNGHIILKNRDGAAIDQAKGDSWPAGENETNKKSMERNGTPGDGLQASSWHSCLDEVCNDVTFWDSEGNNYGTPGSLNHSTNDPTNNPTFEPTPILTPTATPTLNPVSESSPAAQPELSPTPTPLIITPSPTPIPTPEPSLTPAPTDIPKQLESEQPEATEAAVFSGVDNI